MSSQRKCAYQQSLLSYNYIVLNFKMTDYQYHHIDVFCMSIFQRIVAADEGSCLKEDFEDFIDIVSTKIGYNFDKLIANME